MTDNKLSQTLEAISRKELNSIAQRLSIKGFRNLNKAQLIGRLLEADESILRKNLRRTWWGHHQGEVYGALGCIVGLIGIALTILFFVSSRTPVENDKFEQLRKDEIQQQVRLILEHPPEVLRQPAQSREYVDSLPPIEVQSFELLEEAHIWDLRSWQAVPSMDLTKLASPAVCMSEFRLRKRGPASTYSIVARTSGYDVFSRCDSHPNDFRVLAEDSPVSVGGTLLKARILVVNVADVPVGESFDITTTRTYWNGFQGSDQTWCGVTVRQEVLKITFLLILPAKKRFKSYTLSLAEIGSDEKQPYEGEQLFFEGPGQKYLFWEIVKPLPNHVYRIDWLW